MNQVAALAALVVAVAGAALLYLYQQRFEQETSGGAKVEVLAAAGDLNMGSTLSGEAITTRLIPEAYVERRHIPARRAEAVQGVRVRTKITAGEAILWTDLATTGGNSRDLSGLVMPGMRAFPIPASSSILFDGLLRPGDRVDVLLTLEDKEKRAFTRPLIQNLIVLATGTMLGDAGGAGGGGKARVSTVTVSVRPEQGQLLASAMREGKLTLALRNVDDIRVVGDPDKMPKPEDKLPGKNKDK